MPTSFNLSILLIAIAALLICVLLARVAPKSSTQPKPLEADQGAVDVAAAIRDYFRKSGVAVSASATRLDGSTHYTAMVESEPMKRFRLSHLVEKSLVEHVRKACDLELEKVYWRFPISSTPQPVDNKDAYINEGLMNLNDLSNYEVVDSSIEMFTEASREAPKKLQ